MRRIRSAVACAVAAGYVLLQLLARRAGSTQDERQRRLPYDELVPRPQIVTDHAVTLDVAPEDIWPWLAQMGWHLGGDYTPACVDRLLFPDNWPSLDHLDPALVRDLPAGDIIPDGPAGLPRSSSKKLTLLVRWYCTRRRMYPLVGVRGLV
jgi:hypothetical protein